MRITVNGDAVDVTPGSTVAMLVSATGRAGRGTAAALNDEVVPRSAWADTPVDEGDRVEILAASQGG